MNDKLDEKKGFSALLTMTDRRFAKIKLLLDGWESWHAIRKIFNLPDSQGHVSSNKRFNLLSGVVIVMNSNAPIPFPDLVEVSEWDHHW